MANNSNRNGKLAKKNEDFKNMLLKMQPNNEESSEVRALRNEPFPAPHTQEASMSVLGPPETSLPGSPVDTETELTDTETGD